MKPRAGQIARNFLLLLVLLVLATRVAAAPYASMVMDMRTGEVIASRNADTKLHPASLTKMMTLYIAFEAIEHGEISLDTMVTVSANAASEPPSKLGLRQGQRIKLRYLIRAAAVKSANDAATAIGEAIAGSEAAFAQRMNRTAKAMGMTRSHFLNANGLTRTGHMSTARDMTVLGRHVFYDYPDYYNLFSRRTADVGGREVPNTNTRFLNAYRGADGIKTGYTSAAGFNLVASAERGGKRIIATVFGGKSTAARNAKMAELLDLGFRRAPTRVTLRRPGKPPYVGRGGAETVVVASNGEAPSRAGKVIRIVVAPTRSIRPRPRPALEAPAEALVIALEEGIEAVVEDIVAATETPAPEPVSLPEPISVAQAPLEAQPEQPAPKAEPETVIVAIEAETSAPLATPVPAPRPAGIILTSVEPVPDVVATAPEVVTRLSTSGGRHWGINVGRYTTHYEAERVLLKTALAELTTLGEALRKVARSSKGFEANFVGLTEDGADMACRRLEARNTNCRVIGPS